VDVIEVDTEISSIVFPDPMI